MTHIGMSDGGNISVPGGGTLAFVGPDNAGKGVSLRDIHGHLTRFSVPPIAVKSINVDKQDSQEDMISWLDEHCHK